MKFWMFLEEIIDHALIFLTNQSAGGVDHTPAGAHQAGSTVKDIGLFSGQFF